MLVLSYHVNYWDGVGWKDPFSSATSTDRQLAYANTLRNEPVFTPQIIVNGTRSFVGSQEKRIREAVELHPTGFAVQAELSKQIDGHFSVTLTGPAVPADVWEVRYVRHSSTAIAGGENGGRTLLTYNDVLLFKRIGAYTAGTIQLEPLKKPADGIAVLVQMPGSGRILGATAF